MSEDEAVTETARGTEGAVEPDVTEKDTEATEDATEEQQSPPPPPGIPLTIDGKTVYAEKGERVIAAAERNGVHIPRFCYHPRLRSVGMCRMCLVDVDTGRGPMLSPACLVECGENMVVETQSEKALKAQDGVLEFLLINHPLDCPVCDKGGECPLQDNTVAFGPGETRMVEEKRHREKPIALSDLVLLDRERCILCDRCTRFADEVAGDPLINFIFRGVETEVNTFPDHPFASYFSGNTVQLCPVGALTSAPYRFKARPWDLDSVDSTCTTCAVGCRIAVQSSGTQLTRYIGLDDDAVNHSWLCDKGRFSYEAVNSPERIAAPMVRKNGQLVEVSWGEAIDAAAAGLKAARERAGGAGIGVIGGARLANEDAFAWARLADDALGTANVDCHMDDGLPADVLLGLPRATIEDACNAPVVLLLAPDLKEELPVLFLRLRGALTAGRTKLVELTPASTSLTQFAAVSLGYRPGEAGLVARALTDSGSTTDVGPVPAAAIDTARSALAAPGTVVVLGRPSLAESAESVADAARALAALPGVRFLSALRRGNVHGAVAAGLHPSAGGLDTAGMLRAAAAGKLAGLVLLGADPLTDVPDRRLAQSGLAGAGFTVAVDTFLTESIAGADVILPAATFTERPGTTTNIEGRVSPLGQKLTPPGVAWPDWMIAAELATALGTDLGFESLDDLRRAAAEALGGFSALAGDTVQPPVTDAGAPRVDAYGLRLVAGRGLYDLGVTVQKSPSLAGLVRPVALRANPRDLARLGVTTGGRVRVTGPHASFAIDVVADEGVPLGSAFVPANVGVDDARSLIDASSPVTDVRIENL
ncbi:MAG TPA: NADH-quinone oxidoreductase subunit NuoG [Acidimicrobiales bacterium]|nr:NADH-quinone oxidoreductase subunit NuoG [Acidimicrobiales bacterium]